MPELPEVETIARRLRQVLPGKTIRSVDVLRKKSFTQNAELIIGTSIVGVERQAKILSIELSSQQFMLIHLKMTGQLLYVEGSKRLGGGHPTDDFIAALPSKHTRVVITFSDGTELYFNDMRVFGWIKVADEAGRRKAFSQLAPDITDSSITPQYLQSKLTKRTQSIKQAIMDNTLVAGVGNIYACDALHLAKINPIRRANSLRAAEIRRLVSAMKHVIELGIKHGGATIQHYKNVEGLIGHYQDIRRVYAREGEPCGACGTTIVRIKQGGRSTFFCPHCQQ